MNRRQKKKLRNRWETGTAKQRRYNKRLCQRYPFLVPRNVWTDKVTWDKKYAWTLAIDFPIGWWKAFGIMLCEELRIELIRCGYLNKFRFEEIKEKFGGLRIYINSIPCGCKAGDIIDKYSHLSENICIACGKPDVPMIGHNWWSPECFLCWKKRRIKRIPFVKIPETEDGWKQMYEDEKTTGEDTGRMNDTYTYHAFKDKEWIKVEVDISETAGKIREIWRSKHGDI